MLVMIDPGHGGKDPGAVGKYNNKDIYEKDINLAVSQMLFGMLKGTNIIPLLTRSDDYFVDLATRTQTANRIQADFFVSIHTNSTTNSEASGFEVLYYAPGGEGIRLAGTIHDELMARGIKPHREPYAAPKLWVLRKTVMPAVLVEMSYISNPQDILRLSSDYWRVQWASAIAGALFRHKEGI